MENKVNAENLSANMEKKLETFNNEGVAISKDTKHKDVVSESDGFEGVASSAPLYKGAIMWTIWANGGKNVDWPTNWLDMSVQELTDYIISKQN